MKKFFGKFVGFLKNNAVTKFFKGLNAEVKKVVWPSKKQVLNNTLVVLAVCLLSGVALFAVDFVLSQLLELIIG